MLVIIETLATVLSTLIEIYMIIILLRVLIDFLVNYEMITLENIKLKNASKTLYQLTEPIFSWVRKKLPPLNGIDFSAWIVLLVLYIALIILDKIS